MDSKPILFVDADFVNDIFGRKAFNPDDAVKTLHGRDQTFFGSQVSGTYVATSDDIIITKGWH